MKLRILNCPSCGAVLNSVNELDAFYCSTCGSKIMLDEQGDAILAARVRLLELKHEDRLIDKELAHERYKMEFYAAEAEKQRKARQQETRNYLLLRGIGGFGKLLWKAKYLLIVVIIVLVIINMVNGRKESDYKEALRAYHAGQYSDAYYAFDKLNNYKESKTYRQLSNDAWDFESALAAAARGDYVDALRLMEDLTTEEAKKEMPILQEKAYQHAESLVKQDEYVKASAVYETLGTYRDAPQQLKVIEIAKKHEMYNTALQNMEAGKYNEAIEVFLKLDSFEDSVQKVAETKALQLKNPVVGGSVYFGSYEQDNKKANGKEEIKWLVAEIKDNRMLLVSDNVLDRMPYNTVEKKVTWNDSSLRKWLNTVFIEEAFSLEEQARIPSVKISNLNNPEFGTKGGRDTNDKVFLLSIEEFGRYMSDDGLKGFAKWSAYAWKQQGQVILGSAWWLRSPGEDETKAAGVNSINRLLTKGNVVNEIDDAGVRPVIWLNLD